MCLTMQRCNNLRSFASYEVRGNKNRKEDTMRAIIVSGITIVLLGASVFAQGVGTSAGSERSTLARLEAYRGCDLQKLEACLQSCLDHDVEGVVVGALREVAKIKLAQPACASDRIFSRVQDLVRNGTTPPIRYKAYLTSIVLSAPLSFAQEGETEFQTDEQFFTALARKLEMLALRDER
jgi:hypothetical protein